MRRLGPDNLAPADLFDHLTSREETPAMPSSNYPPGVSGNEPQIAGYPDLEAFLDQPTDVLRDELERLNQADRHESQLVPSSVGHAIALGHSATTRDELRVVILAELSHRTIPTGDDHR